MFSESLPWGFPGCAPTALRAQQSHRPPLELSVTGEERKKQGSHDWNCNSMGFISRN